jgi:hypothetical protein
MIAEAIEEIDISSQVRAHFVVVAPITDVLTFSPANESHRSVNVLVIYRIFLRSMRVRPTVKKENPPDCSAVPKSMQEVLGFGIRWLVQKLLPTGDNPL